MTRTELILGVEIEGDARAYSVPLLSRDEIVNDVVGGNRSWLHGDRSALLESCIPERSAAGVIGESNRDDRLATKQLVLGLGFDGDPLAFPHSQLRAQQL